MLLFILSQYSPVGLPHAEPGGIIRILEGAGANVSVEGSGASTGLEIVGRARVEVG